MELSLSNIKGLCEKRMTDAKGRKILYADDEYIIGTRDPSNWVIMDAEKYERLGWVDAATFGYYSNFENLLRNFIRLTVSRSVLSQPFDTLEGLTTWYNNLISQAIKKYFPKIEV